MFAVGCSTGVSRFARLRAWLWIAVVALLDQAEARLTELAHMAYEHGLRDRFDGLIRSATRFAERVEPWWRWTVHLSFAMLDDREAT